MSGETSALSEVRDEAREDLRKVWAPIQVSRHPEEENLLVVLFNDDLDYLANPGSNKISDVTWKEYDDSEEYLGNQAEISEYDFASNLLPLIEALRPTAFDVQFTFVPEIISLPNLIKAVIKQNGRAYLKGKSELEAYPERDPFLEYKLYDFHEKFAYELPESMLNTDGFNPWDRVVKVTSNGYITKGEVLKKIAEFLEDTLPTMAEKVQKRELKKIQDFFDNPNVRRLQNILFDTITPPLKPPSGLNWDTPDTFMTY